MTSPCDGADFEKALLGGHVQGCVDLIRKLDVVTCQRNELTSVLLPQSESRRGKGRRGEWIGRKGRWSEGWGDGEV